VRGEVGSFGVFADARFKLLTTSTTAASDIYSGFCVAQTGNSVCTTSTGPSGQKIRADRCITGAGPACD
jgi:hypothetical protein